MKWMLLPLSYLLGPFRPDACSSNGHRAPGHPEIRERGGRSTFFAEGWRLAVPVVVIDVIKGALPAFAAGGSPVRDSPPGAPRPPSSAVVFPFSSDSRGGKGVAGRRSDVVSGSGPGSPLRGRVRPRHRRRHEVHLPGLDVGGRASFSDGFSTAGIPLILGEAFPSS